MSGDRADVGDCLHALTAEALPRAVAGQDLLPVSLGLQATGLGSGGTGLARDA